ncbi:MAG: hypothetical protein M1824_001430 [Vezdaea acicularis]|nr:MAG: hypothetical protein M1824_001430 [Vezdaea acicularis]
MAPIRRYLRITKYSVLECRIYLDNPALAETWLLNPRKPLLPRVIDSVRPLVLPKLREENERSKGKGKKVSKSVRDVIIEGSSVFRNITYQAIILMGADDFEVSIYLTDLSTRHSLLTKQKIFQDAGKPRFLPNSGKVTSDDAAVGGKGAPVIIREESDELDTTALQDIPAVNLDEDDDSLQEDHIVNTRQSRSRQEHAADREGSVTGEEHHSPRASKSGHRRNANMDSKSDYTEDQGDEKKKLGINTSYEGFSIYGRILCLIVKRREITTGKGLTPSRTAAGSGQAMMEDWIASTQQVAGEDE